MSQMSTTSSSNGFLQRVRAWWRFKFVLPRLREVTLAGVRLDVSTLSPLMRNNLLEGRYEVQERQLASEHLKASDTVLELGGAIGFVGLFCQTQLGITQYVSVEANPRTAELLKTNYALNGKTPTVWNVALAGEDGEVTLNIGDEFWENSLLETGPKSSSNTVTVPALSFASLLAKLPFPITTLIVDIEGAEQFIDFSVTPDSCKKILIELHPGFIGEAPIEHIRKTIAALGFCTVREEGGTSYFERP